MNKWNFPENGNGQIKGISDAGIETFNGKELKALTRETIQNSLDASNSEKPVKVCFFKHRIFNKNIPGIEEYTNAVKNALNYWKNQNSSKTNDYLDNINKKLKKSISEVLQISDYNTKGLSKPFSNDLGGWNSLIKLDGGATKDGDSAGSYGFGKNATFANSEFRLVFYRTLNTDGEKAAQGLCKLVSFPKVPDRFDTMTSGIGYYCDNILNRPVDKIDELDRLNERKEKGTDVFVYGFVDDEKWKDKIIIEVLENFLVSIYEGKLEVEVKDQFGTENINQFSLNQYVYKYQKKSKNAFSYYSVLNESKEYTYDLEYPKGKLILKVYTDKQKELNQRILVVRKAGMKLFEYTNISKLLQFSGILKIEGFELNEFLKKIENPSHDTWEPKRYKKDKKFAKSITDNIKQWTRNTILDLGNQNFEGEVNVEGLGEYLFENIQNEEAEEKNKQENLNNHLGIINILERPSAKQITGRLYMANVQESNTKQKKGTISKDGKLDAPRLLKGKRQRKKREKHVGIVDPKGKDIVLEKDVKQKELQKEEVKNITNIKIFKTDSQKYKLIFKLPKDIKRGHISIGSVGETGKKNTLRIINATGISNCEDVNVTNDVIQFSNIQEEELVKMEFELLSNQNFAMEVNVYEYI